MSSTARTTPIRALVLVAVVLALLSGALPTGSRASAAPLAGGSDFTISSTISASATSPGQPALLVPGRTRYLWYTVGNPLAQPITVVSLGVDRVDAPPGCPVTNLDLGDPTFAGAFVVPGRSSSTVPAPKPISLIDLPDVNQDSCKNVTFTFTFTGTARYSGDPTPQTRTATATVLSAGPNPALQRDAITLTARVTPQGQSVAAATAGVLSGTVTFHLTSASGATLVLGSAPLDSSGTARLRPTALPAGDGRLHATYSGSDTFAASTSPPTAQSIVAPPAQCTGTYTNWILVPADQYRVSGTRASDFIHVVGGDHRIFAGQGNDCIVAGDGTNLISDGSGSDVVISGNGRNTVKLTGSRNTLVVGDGESNRIYVRGTKKGGKRYKPKDNRITVGNGAGNYVKLSKGTRNVVAIGSGAGNRVKATKGFRNQVSIGDGSANRVWMKGRRSIVTAGSGSWNRVTLRRAYRSQVLVGDGARNRVLVTGKKVRVTIGDGERNRVTLRRAYRSQVLVGDGDRNRVLVTGRKVRVTIGDGERNRITVRYTRARVTVGDGAKNRVRVNGSRARVILGTGVGNVVRVTRGGQWRSRCSVPAPPPIWWGWSPVRYYGDRITGCRVVTR